MPTCQGVKGDGSFHTGCSPSPNRHPYCSSRYRTGGDYNDDAQQVSVSRDIYDKYADEFMAKFPASAFGYKEKATLLVDKNEFAEAAKCMEDGIKKSSAKDEAHSNYSDVIYQKLIYKGDSTYTAWTYDKAIEEAQKAYAINANPVYQHREARIIFTKGNYQKAYDMFIAPTKTSVKNSEIFLEAAQG